jgi:hypothetical protein
LKELGQWQETLPNEQWKPAGVGNGKYYISNRGRLCTIDWCRTGRWAILKPSLNPNGYPQATLMKSKGKVMYVRLHRLVAKAFIPNPENLKEVNHIDYNPANNNVENLEWVSRKQNIRHSLKNRVLTFGSENPKSKLTEQQVREIKHTPLPLTHERAVVLAKEYGISHSTLKKLIYCKDRLWPHVQ